jgi:hypothetical protein
LARETEGHAAVDVPLDASIRSLRPSDLVPPWVLTGIVETRSGDRRDQDFYLWAHPPVHISSTDLISAVLSRKSRRTYFGIASGRFTSLPPFTGPSHFSQFLRSEEPGEAPARSPQNAARALGNQYHVPRVT